MKIAISYRHTDDSETLGLLISALKGRFGDDNVYLDSDSTRIGENWLMRWAEAYTAADCILVIIGPSWHPERLHRKHKDVVFLELSPSIQRLVPVLIDGGALPERTQLPRAMRPLLDRQGYVIDRQGPAPSIARFLGQLERDSQRPSSWDKRLQALRTETQASSFGLTGEWELESEPVLFKDIHIQQRGNVLKFWAVGFYSDEIVGEGLVVIGRPAITFTLESKRYGHAGFLVLKRDAKSRTLKGRWMPPVRPILIALLNRRKVTLKPKDAGTATPIQNSVVEVG